MSKGKHYGVISYPIGICAGCGGHGTQLAPRGAGRRKCVRCNGTGKSAVARMSPRKDPQMDAKADIWLLWSVEMRGDTPVTSLLAVDSTEECVNRHKRAWLNQWNEEWGFKSSPPPRVYIEKRQTNHLYGARGL